MGEFSLRHLFSLTHCLQKQWDMIIADARMAHGAHHSQSLPRAVAQFVTLQNTPFLYLGETVVYFIQYQLFAT